jgi:hypothetical protein
MEYISTSSLANEMDIKASELFDKFKTLGWLEKKNDKWVLTDLGKKHGGQTRTNPKFGEYVVWPENVFLSLGNSKDKKNFLSSTVVGEHFNISGQRMNLVLAELGWIEKDIAGWKLSTLGQVFNGRQLEHDTSGKKYVVWPDEILTNKHLLKALGRNPQTNSQETRTEIPSVTSQPVTGDNFRGKFPATLRTKDGHMVRSRAEVIIDNALYEYKLVHAYERKLPVEEELYSDFFIHPEGVYIEYWGMEDDSKYAERKKRKIEIYKKYNFKLIELNDSDIANLDDHLPKKLLKYGIKIY